MSFTAQLPIDYLLITYCVILCVCNYIDIYTRGVVGIVCVTRVEIYVRNITSSYLNEWRSPPPLSLVAQLTGVALLLSTRLNRAPGLCLHTRYG